MWHVLEPLSKAQRRGSHTTFLDDVTRVVENAIVAPIVTKVDTDGVLSGLIFRRHLLNRLSVFSHEASLSPGAGLIPFHIPNSEVPTNWTESVSRAIRETVCWASEGYLQQMAVWERQY